MIEKHQSWYKSIISYGGCLFSCHLIFFYHVFQVYWVGPTLGGALAAALYEYLFCPNPELKRRYSEVFIKTPFTATKHRQDSVNAQEPLFTVMDVERADWQEREREREVSGEVLSSVWLERKHCEDVQTAHQQSNLKEKNWYSKRWKEMLMCFMYNRTNGNIWAPLLCLSLFSEGQQQGFVPVKRKSIFDVCNMISGCTCLEGGMVLHTN